MVYLDNNATTRAADEVIDAVSRAARDAYANPSSVAGSVLGTDRIRLAAATAMGELLNAEEPDRFYFTSGATEANNWVLNSACRGGTVVISDIEHPSVTAAGDRLAQDGMRVVKAAVTKEGLVDLEQLARLLDDSVVLVSIIGANNETGAIQPIAEVGRLVRELAAGATLHSDATQMVGKHPVNLQGDWGEVDIVSFSAHKFHGPKGVGGVYLRPGISLQALLVGGGQEGGLRSGTTNTPGLAGLTVAAQTAHKDFADLRRLRDGFEEQLAAKFPSVIVHARNAPRLANTSCFSIPGIAAVDLASMLALQGIVVGTGSACSAGASEPPHTLLSMGVDYEVAAAALRVSLSRYTSADELKTVMDALSSAYTALVG